MLEGLHIEMAYFSALGDWLDCSGWVAAVLNSEIAKGGFSESLLSGSKVSQTRHVRQVRLCVLEILLKRAYNKEAPTKPFKEWKRTKENKYPQFKFWSLTHNMEILLLRSVRSLRSKNFKFFFESLEEMVPFVFAIDHLNYAGWLFVYQKYLKSLSLTNSTIYANFLEKFCIRKTLRNFSSIPSDHAHEQNKNLEKEDGSAIGLRENTARLTCWMICGPQIARIVNKFEKNMPSSRQSKAFHLHHRQTKSFRDKFLQHVVSLVCMMEGLENSFLENGETSVCLQSLTKYLWLTMVFMWNSALLEKCNFCFWRVFASIK